MSREKRSAIVVTSSVLGSTPTAGSLTYSCAKTFADFLARGLSYELKSKIDCLSWRAGFVSTNMVKKEPKGWVISTTVGVKGMLRDLGKERFSRGVAVHDLCMGLVFNYIPWRVLCYVVHSTAVKKHEEELAVAKK